MRPGIGVEIGRIVLQSVTMDVYSIRARRRRNTGRILYRIEDEYESEWTIPRDSSARPLTLRQLVHLIDGAGWTLQCTNGFPHIEDTVSFLLFDGNHDAESAAAFVSVESTVYPEIERYYQERVLAWARAQLAEREEKRA